MFLADRNILADQAYNAFSAVPPAATDSDLFDVLAYVAFAAQPLTRTERAAVARAATAGEVADKQQALVEFVLAQHIAQGVDELDQEKLSPLLKLKYHNALADAFAELGQPEQVRGLFSGFQRHLYGARRGGVAGGFLPWAWANKTC